MPVSSRNEVVCLPQQQYSHLFSQIVKRGYSFCSNIPSTDDAKNSPFDYVFMNGLSKIEIIPKTNSGDVVIGSINTSEQNQANSGEERMNQAEEAFSKLNFPGEQLKFLTMVVPAKVMKTLISHVRNPEQQEKPESLPVGGISLHPLTMKTTSQQSKNEDSPNITLSKLQDSIKKQG